MIVLENIYKNAKLINIKRSIRYGDLLAKIIYGCFRRCLQTTSLPRYNKGILINEKILNNLRFADDIVLIAKTLKQLRLC